MFSTDPRTGPWVEEDATDPLSVYGASKLAGEEAIRAAGGRYLIFRTSWVYAPEGKNFVLTMLRLGRERDSLNVVDDQIGAPTTAAELARATQAIATQISHGKFAEPDAMGRHLSHDLLRQRFMVRICARNLPAVAPSARRQKAYGQSDLRQRISHAGQASAELCAFEREARSAPSACSLASWESALDESFSGDRRQAQSLIAWKIAIRLQAARLK